MNEQHPQLTRVSLSLWEVQFETLRMPVLLVEARMSIPGFPSLGTTDILSWIILVGAVRAL